jgi:hypothetical protein
MASNGGFVMQQIVRFVRSKWCRVAALVLATGIGGLAHAADLAINPYRFFLVYQVKNTTSPVYQVLPQPGGASFNDANTPMLIPCGVQMFGGQLNVQSAGPDDVYPRVTFELYRSDTNSIIVSHGYSGNVTFDHLDMNISALLAAGQSEDAGFTPVSKVSVFKDWLYQPKDLPANVPVRMDMAVSGFADSQFTQGVNDPNPSNDVLKIWIMRACK